MSEKKCIGVQLRAARKAHGLTVADLAERFREVASDRVRLLRRGRRGPGTSEEGERLALAVRNPARLDGIVIDGLAVTLANQRRVEDVIGSQAVLGTAQAHLALVMRLLREAPDAHAARLLALASEASQFNGWLNTAVDAHAAAAPLYDQALRFGLQAGDKDLAATALSMRGHLAWASGEYRDMASLSETAAGMATAAGTRAVATQQRGRALALLGDRQGALRAVGRAEDVLAGQRGTDPDGLYFYGSAMLTMQRGLILGYLEEHATAADLLTDGIQAMPEGTRESEWVAWYRVKAAAARALAGDPEHTVAELRAAIEILATTGGTKTLRDIAHVHRILKTRYPKHPAVAELTVLLPDTRPGS
ncbi:hypothetical protein [Actinomadura opuntiae]|uniref:hypothetical protein n=1 Tax=Actinomadura sp. OS1-43 TaxID=604315 RepID=UPI00255B06C8|nr:hypothetical protein [Actinomadura sp. OS1-43]MDL4813505.1 hypothetical protein [Actinomadura sp. OS1-43]